MDPPLWQAIVGVLAIQVLVGASAVGAVLSLRAARRALRGERGVSRVAWWVVLGGVLVVLALTSIVALLVYGAVAATVLLWQFGAAVCGC